MKFRKIDEGYLLRLEKGDEVIETLTRFAREQKIPAGFITGMGAVTDATLGIYDTEHNEYVEKKYFQDLEVGNMTGNITWLSDNEPFVHCHITIADRSLNAFTGHLFSAIVSVTLEVFIRTFTERLIRAGEPGTNFKFWQL